MTADNLTKMDWGNKSEEATNTYFKLVLYLLNQKPVMLI